MEDSAFPESIPPKSRKTRGAKARNYFFEEKSKKSREKFGGIKINP